MKSHTLWTRNYTTITIGTIISAIGGVGLNFALSVLIYNKTGSTLLSALFAGIISVPNILLPLFIGPYIDKLPRKWIIVISDFMMGLLFLMVGYITRNGYFAYVPYMLLGILISTNGVIYHIAYESLFPELIPKGMLQKGYSISSLIYPTVNTLVLPVAAVVFERYGISGIFLIEGFLLMIASFFEMQIKIEEKQAILAKANPQPFWTMVKEGFSYLKQEKGLIAIFVYFFFIFFTFEGLGVLLYPFFENHPMLDVTMFALLMSFGTAGRLFGGLMHYVIKIPTHLRFKVAAIVYFSLNILGGILLFTNYYYMIIIQFLMGVLSINSFNIRMSSVQSYVPSEKRGRVNGVFQILVSLGMLSGRLLSGSLGEFFKFEYIVLGLNMFGLLAFYMIIWRNRQSIALIYDRKV
jgi:MFS transporter, DHA3 family, macrolide efflux protein